jgi:hypothetical protein
VSLRLSAAQIATPESLPEIAALLDRIFPSPRARMPELEWQYLQNPAGPARYVNAYGASGELIAHYAVLPTPPLADSPSGVTGTYFSLNTAVDPAAKVPGLMVATGRALFRQLSADGPVIVLGVANENSYQGFVKLLGFRSLGRLLLTAYPPGQWPKATVPRALTEDHRFLEWRARRPGVRTYSAPAAGALTVRLHYRGLPLDAVLTAGLAKDMLEPLDLPAPALWVPRLYATFGSAGPSGGFVIPERLRPSPLEYIVQTLGDRSLTDGVARYLTSRRFEFLDFDVV